MNANALDQTGGGAFESFAMIGQVILILLVVIGLFYITIRILAKRNRMIGASRSLRSLGGIPLGTNKSIQIIEIGTSLYIIGVGENIQLLEKIDDPEEVAFLTEMLDQKLSPPQFASLTAWLQKWGKKEPTEEDVTSTYQQVFFDKMQSSKNRKQRFEDILQEKQTDRLNDE